MEESTLLGEVMKNIHSHFNDPAVVFDDGQLPPIIHTYRQVHQLSLQIQDILYGLHVENEVLGVCLPPFIHLPALLLGILKANAAFYNFEASAVEFVQYVVNSVGIRFLLLNQENIKIFESFILSCDSVIVRDPVLESTGVVLIHLQSVTPRKHDKSLAYCITTSGTTGSPKVVLVPHSCILPNIKHLRSIFNVCENDLIFLSSPLTFDPSIVDLFLSLVSGASLLLVPHLVKMRPRSLLNLIFRRHKVTVLQATPSSLSRIGSSALSETILGSMTKLRVLALGGERFPPLPVLQQWKAHDNQTRIFNLYGTTELSCWASYYELSETDFTQSSEDIPLGSPLQDTQLKVINRSGKEITDGEGHLYTGGINKRQCYLEHEDKTQLASPPLRPTGDWVKIDKTGTIVFLHRLDDQVKRNGRRINLCEIEEVVYQLADVSTCTVLYEDSKLYTFVVLRDTDEPHSVIESWIQSRLPSHYWPDFVVVVHEIPVTKHGKCDKLALIKIVNDRNSKEMSEDSTNTRTIVESVWNEILSLSGSPSKDAMFLLSGGDSLQAVKFVDILESKLQSPFPDLLDIVLHKKFCDVMNYLENKSAKLHSHVSNELSSDSKVLEIYENNSIYQNTEQTYYHKTHKEVRMSLTGGSEIFDNNDHKKVRSSAGGTRNIGRDKLKQTKIHPDDDGSAPKKPRQSRYQNVTDTSCDARTAHMSSEIGEIIYTVSRGNRIFVCRNASETSDSMSFPVINKLKENKDLINGKTNYMKAIVDTGCDNIKFAETVGNVSAKDDSHYNKMTQKKSCTEMVSGIFSSAAELDKRCTGIEIPKRFNLQQRWKFDTGKCVDASPLIAKTSYGQHIVYFGSHSHRFSAIFLESGKLLWTTILGDRIESSACSSHCGKYVLTGCYDGALYSLTADTGKVWWKFVTGAEVKSSPVVDSLTSLVFVGSHDKHLYALNVERREMVYKIHLSGGSVFSSPNISYHPHVVYACTLSGHVTAIHPDDGSIIWQYTCTKPVFSSPCVTDSGVYVGCVDGAVYHVSHTGQLLWKYQTNAPVFSTPVSLDAVSPGGEGLPSSSCNEIFIFGSHDCHVHSVSGQGHLFWSTQVDSPIYATPFLFNLNLKSNIRTGNVSGKLNDNKECTNKESICTDGCINMECMCTTDGCINVECTCTTEVCPTAKYSASGNKPLDVISNQNTKMESRNSRLCLSDWHCENKMSEQCCVFATTNGTLYVVSAITGEILLRHDLPGEVFSSPIVFDGHIVVGCRDDYVYCLSTPG